MPVERPPIRSRVVACVLLLAALEHTSAQNLEVQSAIPGARDRLLLALSTPEYPVTPGDTYLLSYSRATAAVGVTVERASQTVVVGSNYTISLGVSGFLNGRGLRFNDLRHQVVTLVEEAYPTSNPELLLTSVGAFEVHLRGEVGTAGPVTTWGLGRLSEVLGARLTAYGSIRDVRIERAGTTTEYDLFEAQRFGIRSQDPYVAAGDRICVSRVGRVVTIGGQVRRPGAYQLLLGEGLAEVVAYAGGLAPRADLERIRIDSLAREPSQDEAATPAGSILPAGALHDCDGEPFPPTPRYRLSSQGTTRYAAWDAALAREPLHDQDAVTFASRDALLPVVFFEGAVTDGRLEHRYRPGQTLYGALQQVRRSVATSADLGSSTIARRGAPEEPIDLDLLLHGGSREGDRELQPLDRIIIPPRRFEVALRGEVTQARQLTVSPLTRLSEVVDDVRTPYTSIRRIAVESANGQVRTYDLFRWQRFGELAHNPLLRPGATVTFRARDREVHLSGLVRRPGAYQLLPGEGLAEVVAYAGGLAPRADLERIRIDSLAREPSQDEAATPADSILPTGALHDGDGEPFPPTPRYRLSPQGTTRYAAWDAALAREPLHDQDVVTFASRDALLPVVFFEGAVTDGRLEHRYRPGQTLYGALQQVRRSVATSADLGSSTIARRGAPEEPIDLDLLLHGGSREGDRELQPLDRIIIPPRRFEVALRGEVTQARQLTVSPLTRLSEVVDDVRTPYTSIRRIAVESANGQVRTYDLFRWQRFGELAHNPLLRPGATVTFRARDREVHLSGLVRRPGAYQLLPGEGLAEVVAYAGGLAPRADLERIRIDSLAREPSQDEAATPADSILPTGALHDGDGEPFPPTPRYRLSPQGTTRYAAWDAALAREPLHDQDVVTFASRDALLPVVFFEGAVTDGRLEHRYRPGQTLYGALQQVRRSVATSADLGSSTIARRGAPEEPIDLDLLLHGGSREGDRELQPLDRIIIPPRRFEVALRGEVTQARQLTVSPLTRLSEVVDDVRTPYTSIRRIAVESANGQVRTYDLFRWQRFGELAHNPLLRPGATVTFRARDREVHLSGLVRRPGAYQLLAGDGLAELIDLYGEGFAIGADSTRLVITRRTPDDPDVVVESIPIDSTTDPGTPLRDGDSVAVPSALARLPVVYVDGALAPLRADDPLLAPTGRAPARPRPPSRSGRRQAAPELKPLPVLFGGRFPTGSAPPYST